MHRQQISLKIVKTVLYLMSLLLATTQYSFAHTQLTQSVPPANAVLKNTPRALKLNFAEPVNLLSIQIKDGQSKKIPLKFKATRQASPHFHVATPELKKGRYKVEWKIQSQDGHIMTGQYSFRIQ